MSNRNKISQFEVISQLRFPMIVLVTFAHSYGSISADYSLLTSEWNTYEFLKLCLSQTLVKVAMPVFFIMSGYLFFSNVEEWNLNIYREKIFRRVKTLLIPYLIWNLLMAVKLKTFSWNIFWTFWSHAGVQTDWLGNEQLMTAPINMPLWFLRDLMIVSLLTPIIYIGVRKLGIWLIGILTVIYLSGISAFVPGLSAYAVYFFTFGAFLSIRKMDLIISLRRLEIPAYVLSLILGVAMLISFGTTIFSSLMLAFRLAGAIAVFCIASRILSHSANRLPKLLCDSSYFIFLAHYVFFFSFIDAVYFSLLGSSTVSMCFHYLLCPLLKVSIFVAVYAVYFSIKRRIASQY